MKKSAFVNKYEYPSFMASALAIHGSVTPKVLKSVSWVVMYSIVISFINSHIVWLAIPVGPFEYAGLIMGLILVFRINAGYDRWWEARKVWGNLVNKSRNMAIMVANYVDASEKDTIAEILKMIATMPYLMKQKLRHNPDIDEIKHLIDNPLYTKIETAHHRPNYLSSVLASRLGKLMKNGKLAQMPFLKIEEQREIIVDCQGACERILYTPMPFVMAIKSRRFILLFLIVLPLALVNLSLYISPLITALVAYALFSLDQIGVELQNPFSEEKLSHLPLSEICETIENNIDEILIKNDS